MSAIIPARLGNWAAMASAAAASMSSAGPEAGVNISWLNPSGRWLQPVSHAAAGLALAPLVRQRITMADITRHPHWKGLLTTLTELIEAGKVTPVIDRRYPFTDISEAVSYQEKGHAAGKVAVTVSG